MLWQGVWEMVTAARLSPEEFIRFAVAHAGDETDDYIHGRALGSIQSALAYLARLSPDGSTGAVGAQVEDWLWQAFLAAESGSDRQVFLFDSYVRAVSSVEHVGRLAGLLTAPELPEGFALDQDRRWDLLIRVAGFDHPSIDTLLEAEAAADATDQGRRSALAVAAARPDPAQQRRFAESLLAPDAGMTAADARAIARGLFPTHQQALQVKLAPDVFARLEASSDLDPSYFRAIAGGLLGPACDRTYLDMLNATLSDGKALHPSLRKSLMDQRFEVNRCLTIGEAFP